MYRSNIEPLVNYMKYSLRFSPQLLTRKIILVLMKGGFSPDEISTHSGISTQRLNQFINNSIA